MFLLDSRSFAIEILAKDFCEAAAKAAVQSGHLFATEAPLLSTVMLGVLGPNAKAWILF